MGVMERFPIIITLGAALLGWVAGEMLLTDPGLNSLIVGVPASVHGIIKGAAAAAVVGVGRWLSHRQAGRAAQAEEGTGTTP
jgi:predicted tellurium resistance membrane protein TerC